MSKRMRKNDSVEWITIRMWATWLQQYYHIDIQHCYLIVQKMSMDYFIDMEVHVRLYY